jgi:RND family efflux transporter MFP subunit
MKPRPLVRTAIAALVPFVAVACASPPRQEPADRPATARVSVGRATMTTLVSSFEAGGVVRARNTALVASRVLAPITEITVRPGDRVRRGDVLVRLDARDRLAGESAAAAAALSAEDALHAAEADVRSAGSALTLAKKTQARIASMQSDHSATSEELDRAEAGLAAAEAQLAGADARVAAATASRDAARAAQDGARIAAGFAVLTAPFDGVITERHTDPGSMATPGDPLLTIEDPSTFRLEVSLDATRAGQVALGQTAAVRLEEATGAGAWTDARVAEIARVEPGTHAFLVKLDLDAASAWRSGLFARARFAGPSRTALTAPASALITRGQLTSVFKVDAENRARMRPVLAGGTAPNRVEVLAGLTAGDAVVLNPPPSLADGDRVQGVAQ